MCARLGICVGWWCHNGDHRACRAFGRSCKPTPISISNGSHPFIGNICRVAKYSKYYCKILLRILVKAEVALKEKESELAEITAQRNAVNEEKKLLEEQITFLEDKLDKIMARQQLKPVAVCSDQPEISSNPASVSINSYLQGVSYISAGKLRYAQQRAAPRNIHPYLPNADEVIITTPRNSTMLRLKYY